MASHHTMAIPGKIFVGGLAEGTTFDTFLKHFEKYGRVIDAFIAKDKRTGQTRGFGFITFVDPAVVDIVIQDPHIINGKTVEIKRAIQKVSARDNDSNTKKIFVGGIPASVTEEEFMNFFSRYGTVVEREIIYDRETTNSRGFGFIEFESEKVAADMVAMGVIEMAGKRVEIKKAVPMKGQDPRSGPAFGSDYRRPPYNNSFGRIGSYGDPLESYRPLGGFGGGYSDYGMYGGGGGPDFGGSFGGLGGGGGGGFPGYHGESSFGSSSQFGSSGGGLGGSGLGAYGHPGYGSYGGSGSAGGYDSAASFGGPGGFNGSRARYDGSSGYHPYRR